MIRPTTFLNNKTWFHDELLIPWPNFVFLLSLEPFVWTVEPSKAEVIQKLTTATRSMEHMNSLLHETEATNAVLMEQITVSIIHPGNRHKGVCNNFDPSVTLTWFNFKLH